MKMDLISRTRASLRKSVRIEIVTSGYTDRFLAYSPTYSLPLSDSTPDAVLQWTDMGQAIASLLALDDAADEREVIGLVTRCPTTYWGRWQDGATSSAGPVRPDVIRAILDSHDAHITPAYREQCVALATQATPSERAFTRWGLVECNRCNQRLVVLGLRPGHETQVSPAIADEGVR